MFKRLLLVFMALIMVMSCFVSCRENIGGDDTTDGGEVVEPTPDPILCSAIATYTIIRPEVVSEDVLDGIIRFNMKMREVFGTTVQFKDDFYREDVEAFKMSEYEILIGVTNRPETQKFLDSLKPNDYGYALVEKKIVIAGWTDSGTIRALDHFFNNILSKYSAGQQFTADDVFYSTELNYNAWEGKTYDAIALNGIPAIDFRIVYPESSPNGEAEFATKLSSSFKLACGFNLDVVSDKYPTGEKIEHEILIGKTNRTTDDEYASYCADTKENEGVIVFNGKNYVLAAADMAALKVTVDRFIEKIPTTLSKQDVLFEEKTVCEYNDDSIFAMTFNVQVWFTDGTGGKTARIKRVKQMIQTYMPDVIGFQEVSGYWQNILVAEFGKYYGYTGLSRDGSSDGERNMIFYNKSRFKLIDCGTKWHSETPDVISKHPDAAAPECLVYTVLERKSDGVRFVHLNCHLDWTNGQVRTYQSEKMLEYVKAHFADYPIIWTGDFNYSSSSDGFRKITQAGYKSSLTVAKKVLQGGPTFTSYGEDSALIDHIFVDPSTIFVKTYKVCLDKFDGWYPSDHHPVIIEFSIMK